MIELSKEQERLHRRAVRTARVHRRCEWRMIQILQEVERAKLYKAMGYASLYVYTVSELDLTNAVAYSFNSVARKAMEVPELQEFLRAQKVSVHRASRLVAALTAENAKELLEFAQKHTERELEFEVARRNPKSARREKMRPISAEQVEVYLPLGKDTYEMLEHVQNLVAQKVSIKNPNFEAALKSALGEYIERHDPVRKAARAREKQRRREEQGATRDSDPVGPGSAKSRHSNQSATSPQRIPLTAAEEHAVNARDEGRCTYVDGRGRRCTQERWLHKHHIIPVSRGGSNDPANIVTLCSFHHDLVHQLSLPVEGQVSWLRESQVLYTV